MLSSVSNEHLTKKSRLASSAMSAESRSGGPLFYAPEKWYNVSRRGALAASTRARNCNYESSDWAGRRFNLFEEFFDTKE